MIRIIKCVLSLSIALMCTFYALQNLVNLQAAYGFVALMAGMGGHEAYASHFGPAITSPAIIWLILSVIIVSELTAGLVSAKGAFDMWKARSADAAAFNAAKKLAIVGAGIGVITWLGYFGAIGGAYFQMWQTQAGAQALQGAFQYTMMCGLVMILLSMQDE